MQACKSFLTKTGLQRSEWCSKRMEHTMYWCLYNAKNKDVIGKRCIEPRTITVDGISGTPETHVCSTIGWRRPMVPSCQQKANQTWSQYVWTVWTLQTCEGSCRLHMFCHISYNARYILNNKTMTCHTLLTVNSAFGINYTTWKSSPIRKWVRQHGMRLAVAQFKSKQRLQESAKNHIKNVSVESIPEVTFHKECKLHISSPTPTNMQHSHNSESVVYQLAGLQS